MSVSITHYLGIGYKLDYDKYTDKVDAFLDEHLEYSRYEHLNPKADKPGLQIIVDGMNGNYIYVMYVLKKTEDYDMYSSSGDVAFSLINASPESSVSISVRKLYQSVTGDKPNDPKLISFFHCA